MTPSSLINREGTADVLRDLSMELPSALSCAPRRYEVVRYRLDTAAAGSAPDAAPSRQQRSRHGSHAGQGEEVADARVGGQLRDRANRPGQDVACEGRRTHLDSAPRIHDGGGPRGGGPDQPTALLHGAERDELEELLRQFLARYPSVIRGVHEDLRPRADARGRDLRQHGLVADQDPGRAGARADRRNPAARCEDANPLELPAQEVDPLEREVLRERDQELLVVTRANPSVGREQEHAVEVAGLRSVWGVGGLALAPRPSGQELEVAGREDARDGMLERRLFFEEESERTFRPEHERRTRAP